MMGNSLAQLSDFYRDQLLNHCVNHWEAHSLDRQYGGYFDCLDRDWTVFDDDKHGWNQGRKVWMWSTLYRELEPRKSWLEAAKLGADFLAKYGTDETGRAHFALKRDGTPLIKPRDIFADAFQAMGHLAYWGITKDKASLARAWRSFKFYFDSAEQDWVHDAACYTGVRPCRTHAIRFIKLTLAQEFRKILGPEHEGVRFDKLAAQAVDEILNYHVKPEYKALLEYVGLKGELLPGAMGRLLNPGHALEIAGFIISEAQHQKRDDWLKKACDVILWHLDRAWDTDHGGIFYYMDLTGNANRKLESTMKLWWVHSDTLVSCLQAYLATGDERFKTWHDRVHDWAFDHFTDRECGEWYGYLHYDGTVSMPLKGGIWKGMFHVPRAWLNIHLLLKDQG